MGNDIFLKKYFFPVIVNNWSCTLFGQTSHCAPPPQWSVFSKNVQGVLKLKFCQKWIGLTQFDFLVPI